MEVLLINVGSAGDISHGSSLDIVIKSARQDMRGMPATAVTRYLSPEREPCWLKDTQSRERTGDRNNLS